MNKKTIRFTPATKQIDMCLDAPKPASEHVPEWYRHSQRFTNGKMESSPGGLNKDIKLCVPFLDAMISGYCIELASDIFIERNNNGVGFLSQGEIEVFKMRPKDTASLLPRPSGTDFDMYAWTGIWGTETPKGYSSLFVHPLNRFDLPFITTSGIIDSDKHTTTGEIPFFLKQGFEGIIPAGTPIVQIIPFKREEWVSQKDPYDEAVAERKSFEINKHLVGAYRKLSWQRKSYK